MIQEWEKEFFSLAGVMPACNLKVMGGKVIATPKEDIAFPLLGMVDYAREMSLLLREVRERNAKTK